MIVVFAWCICLNGISERRKIGIILILVCSTIQPHCNEISVPVFTFLSYLVADETLLEAMNDTDSSESSISSSSSIADAASSLSATKPFSQAQLNDLARDLGLSKESSEILASRLGEHGILD